MVKLGTQVAIIESGKVLLIQREDFEGWGLPGGEIEAHETAAIAAIREAHEETGLVIALTGLVGLYVMPARDALGLDTHVALFSAKVIGGELKPQTNETLDARFFHPDELPNNLLWDHRSRILDAVNGASGSIQRVQEFSHSLPELVTSRADLYRLRDQSGLSRSEFFAKYLNNPGKESVEVGQSPLNRP